MAFGLRDKIFVNYRRADSASDAQGIAGQLRNTFGTRAVFVDISMRGGERFEEVLAARLSKTAVMLSIIGPNWLAGENDRGESRLENDGDWVRREIGEALGSAIPVIPVTVRDAKMPVADCLPAEIQSLAGQQERQIRNATYFDDIAALRRDISHHLRRVRWFKRGGFALFSLLVLAACIAGYVERLNLQYLAERYVLRTVSGADVAAAREMDSRWHSITGLQQAGSTLVPYEITFTRYGHRLVGQYVTPPENGGCFSGILEIAAVSDGQVLTGRWLRNDNACNLRKGKEPQGTVINGGWISFIPLESGKSFCANYENRGSVRQWIGSRTKRFKDITEIPCLP